MYASQTKIRKITLTIHFRDEEIPLVIYGGTSEQAIFEHIRDVTNLYRFRCVNKKQQPIILSSNLPDKTHIYVQDPNEREEEESDEPSPEEQIEYLKDKTRELLDAKNVLNAFKAMLISLEIPPPADDNKEDEADKVNVEDTTNADGDVEVQDAVEPPSESTTEEVTSTVADDDTKTDEVDPDTNPSEEQKDGDAVIAVVSEEDKVPKDPYQYDGKYKELIAEIEGKMDEFQSVIMAVYNVSDDLIPPKEDLFAINENMQSVDDQKKDDVAPQNDDNNDAAVDAVNAVNPVVPVGDESAETSTEEKREEVLMERIMAKLQPNMVQMQELIKMQQMAVITMINANAALANGGGGGIGGGGGAMMNLNAGGVGTGMLLGASPMLGAAASVGPPTAGQPALEQSATSAAAPVVVEEAKTVDKTAECKEWFKSSELIDDDEYATLMGFFDDKGASIKNMEKLFQASQHHFDSSIFHQKCDDMGFTLVIIQSEHGHVFGGFTKASWKDQSTGRSGTWREDKDAFIFLLRSPKDNVLPGHWKVLPEKKEKTIKADKSYGPIFGYGYDIRLCNQCNRKKESSSQLDNEDACFGAPEDDDYLTGEFYFLVKEYEVYKVVM